MLTLEELERKAYISGDSALADLYGRLEQLDETGEIAEMTEEIVRLEHEVSRLEKDVYDLEDDLEYWRERAIKAEGQLENVKWLETKEKE